MFVLNVVFPRNSGKMHVVGNLVSSGFEKMVKFGCFVIVAEREKN